MESATIAALLQPFAELTPAVLAKTSTYLELLVKWNAKVNLTAVRDREGIITRHFGESFFAARTLFPEPRWESAVDLGSGAGFPGLPLAMLRPEVEVTLVESNSKKAAFLSEAIRVMELGNARVFSRRAEAYPTRADLVAMRAVEEFGRAVRVAADLVREGGRIALMIGPSQLGKARMLVPQVKWQEPWPLPGGGSRLLLAGIKSVGRG